jgi:subfamily B ATP-binding cassette protein MsbA
VKKSLTLYVRLLGYAKPYWKVVAVSLLAMLLVAVLEPVLPALLKPLIDKGLIEKSRTNAWTIPLLIVVVFLAKGAAEYVASVSSQWVAQKAIADIREQVFSHQIRLDLMEHQRQGPGAMTSRIVYDTAQVGTALSSAWLTIIRDSFVIMGLLAYLLYLSWSLTLLVLIMAPMVAVMIHYASRKLRISNERLQQNMALLTTKISESLLGLKEIKIFAAERAQTENFKRTSEQVRKETMRAARVQSLNVPLVQVIAALAVAGVILLATQLSQKDLLSPGEFVSFIAAMSMIFEPVRRLTNVNAVIQRGLAASTSIFSVLDTKPEVGFDPLAEPLGSERRRPRARGEITVRHLSHAYDREKGDVLTDVSLDIPANKLTAFVGPSGGGKSTLAALIAGFYVPTCGSILLDGRSIEEWGLSAYRAQFATVGQNVALFDASVLENLLMGNPTADLAQVRQAAEWAGILDFIESLPLGFQTPLGSLGNELSGGQRQRLAIARAFLKDAPILVLDEPTSALDSESEAIITASVEKLREQRTILVVAHRLSTIESADQVLVLDQGRLIASGPPETLRNMGYL